MNMKDWILACLSGGTLLWTIIAFFWNRSSSKASSVLAEKAEKHATAANRLAERANTISEQTGRRLTAESELAVLRLINEARVRVCELFVRVTNLQAGKTPSKITADENRQIASLQMAHEQAVEVLLNSYELACGLYLDGGKLDDERFRRQYYDEIKRLFDFPEPYRQRLHPVNSPYHAIRKVHEQWHNLERDK